MEKITFCIPSKSNLRYLKTCIPSIRENAYRKDHDIIVFVDQDEDGTVEWLSKVAGQYKVKYYINPKLNKELFGIGKAYDYCVENSETDVFMIFHADMMLGINADLNAFKKLTPMSVVCSTRIEPPIHPNAGEKILQDFGMWPEEFKNEEFNQYVTSQLDTDKVTDGIFAPWMMFKKDYKILGGHDPILKSAREDSDLFNRMALAGFEFKQPWNSLVYHLTGRGGQFQHGEITQEHEQKSKEWQKLMNNSTMDFIRKWGTQVFHTPLMKPIVVPKYNIAFVVTSCNYDTLRYLEPFCDRIYIEDEMQVLYSYYWDEFQKETEFDLSKRVLNLNTNDPDGENDIVVFMNNKTLNQQDYENIPLLSRIAGQIDSPGIYGVGNLTIKVNSIITYEKDYITLDNTDYLNKLKK